MNSRGVSLAFILVLLSFATFLTLNGPVAASPAEIVVPDDHKKIQWAIGNATEGDTVFVRAGIYNENLVISKSLKLIGENKSTTILDANGIGHGIHVKANSVHISGFTIQNCQFYFGIYLDMKKGAVIKGNVVKDNQLGIYVQYSVSNIITNNLVTSNQYGIRVFSSSGNIIADNIITSTRSYAIDLYGGSRFNRVYGNAILNNLYYLSCGIHIGDSDPDNIIYHNSFVNNTCHARCKSVNTWDDGYPSGGNYWSDYNGKDLYSGPYQNEAGSDGIGDTPYRINDDNQDRYPLMYQRPDITSPTTTNDYDGQWHTSDVIVNLSATDDKSGVKETYYKINDAPPTRTVSADGQPIITTESADNKLEYWSVDNVGNVEFPHRILTGIKLDKTSPVTTISVLGTQGTNGWYLSDATMTLVATDKISGVAKTEYSFDSATWIIYTLPFNIVEEGNATVYYRSTDVAGNVETVKSETIGIDKTKPFIGTPSQAPPGGLVEPNQKVAVSVEVTDGLSGLREVLLQYRYSVDEGRTWTMWTDVLMTKTVGDNYVGEIPGLSAGTRVQYGIVAYDNAGNVATKGGLGQYYVYTVIPEFQMRTAILAALCTLSVVLLFLKQSYKKRRISERRIF